MKNTKKVTLSEAAKILGDELRISYDHINHFILPERGPCGSSGILFIIPKVFPLGRNGHSLKNPIVFKKNVSLSLRHFLTATDKETVDLLYGKYTGNYVKAKSYKQIWQQYYEPTSREIATHVFIRVRWNINDRSDIQDIRPSQVENILHVHPIYHIRVFPNRNQRKRGMDYWVFTKEDYDAITRSDGRD